MNFLKGRMNRASYWLGLGIVVAAVVALSFLSPKNAHVSEAVLIFLAVPRLHDIGRSGWWVVVPLVIEFVGVITALVTLPLETAMAAIAGVTLVIAGLMIWLGCLRGQPGANRFGEPPSPGLFKTRARARTG